MKTQLPLRLIILAVLAVLALSACSSNNKPVDVTLSTYKIVVDRNSTSSGDVTFHIHNDSDDGKTHEFVIFKTDLPEDQLPMTSEGVVDEEGAGVTHIDEREDIEAGSAVDMTVNLAPGNYVLLCNIDSTELHYQHGMHTAFVVK